MTNEQIIFAETQRLAAEGVLRFTGRTLHVVLDDGTPADFPEVEEVHTFAEWKARGYAVKRGEHARAAFPVWCFSRRTGNGADGGTDTETDSTTDGDTDGGTAPAGGRYYMRRAFWFTRDQVQELQPAT